MYFFSSFKDYLSFVLFDANAAHFVFHVADFFNRTWINKTFSILSSPTVLWGFFVRICTLLFVVSLLDSTGVLIGYIRCLLFYVIHYLC
jgi:hypothetical protein